MTGLRRTCQIAPARVLDRTRRALFEHDSLAPFDPADPLGPIALALLEEWHGQHVGSDLDGTPSQATLAHLLRRLEACGEQLHELALERSLAEPQVHSRRARPVAVVRAQSDSTHPLWDRELDG